MKIFIDSANIEEINEVNQLGIIDGVTTNPSLISKEDKSFEKIIQLIIDEIAGKPINVEIMSTETEEMVKEAIKLSELYEKIVIKIPIVPNGLKAVRILKSKNINTNVTLVFSVNQALLAAKAGAKFVSIFVGRLDDIGHTGIDIIKDSMDIFNSYNIDTEIIAASIRHPLHVIESARTGTDVATIPFEVLEKMIYHPLTDIGIEKFKKDWENVKNQLII